MTEWDGVQYRQVNTLQQWLAARALDHLDLTGVHRLLDIGCGDGRVTAEIADRIPDSDVVGIDPSPHMIDIAPGRPGLQFEIGDVQTMSYRDEFDAAVSFNALHWVRDQQRALERIHAALRSPGSALLVLVCGGPRLSIEEAEMQVCRSPRWRRYFADFDAPYCHPDPQVWQRMAADAHWRTNEQGVDDLSWDFGSRKAFTRWATVGSNAWTTRLPQGAVEEFMDEVLDAYGSATGSDSTFRFLQLRSRLSKS